MHSFRNLIFLIPNLLLYLSMLLRHLVITILFFAFNKMDAQEILFHVNTASPVSFNPAYAGKGISRYGNYGRLIIASQKSDFQRTNSQIISHDWHSPSLGGGLGLIIVQQDIAANLIKLYFFKGIYNYILPINKSLTFKFAIQPGYEVKSLNPDRLSELQSSYQSLALHPSIYDSIFENNRHTNSKNYLTLGSGILAQTQRLELGIAFQNMNRPNWSFSDNVVVRKSMQSTFHIQYKLIAKKKFELYAKSLMTTQTSAQLFNFGLQFKSKHWMGGVSLNQYQCIFFNRDYLLGTVGYTYRIFQLRYGYELRLDKQNTPIVNNQSISLQVQIRMSNNTICHPPFPRQRFNDITF